MQTSEAKLIQWLVAEWCSRFAQALESMAGERPGTGWKQTDEPAAPAPGSVLWWEQPFSIAPGAPVWVGAPRETWRGIGAAALRGAGIDEPEEADRRSTYLEVLSQSFAGLAQAVGAQLGKEVNPESGAEAEGPPQPYTSFAIELTLGQSPLPPLSIAVDPALLAAIAGPAESAGEPAGEQRAESPKPATSKTLDLLMEVELPVSVSFGRAEMPLRDLLKLATGSIVELNRTVSEPVEVIVNNCVIARGEVVVVEGNYGVRIKEIISRQERLRTLR